jgi:hypothetical protein
MNEIKVNNKVQYAEPMADEIGVTFKVIEVNGDRCIIEALVGMEFNPTYVALTSDLKVIA